MNDIWPTLHDAMMGPQRMRYPDDKVITLNSGQSPNEFYSVPLGDDPYSYSRHMHERNNMRGPISAFRIECGGLTRTHAISEIANYTPPRRS